MRTQARKSVKGAVVAAVLAAFVAPGAASAEITVDPDGPAGQEYAAPFAQARDDAAGRDGSAGVPGSEEESVAFGVGVEGLRGGGTPGGSDQAKQRSGTAGASPESLAAIDYEGSGDLLGVMLICALVLGTAAGLAFVLGRRSKPDPA